MRNFHFPGRSTVYARHAIAATSHPLASGVAIDILKRGGNAVDAAIATAATLCVVEHAMTGIGGDCFAIVARPDGTMTALNASGRAPQAATAEALAAKGVREIVATTPHAVLVPGAIDGWCRLLADHGTMTLAEVLAPAIAFAEDGFAITPRVAHDWSKAEAKLKLHEGARKHLLPGGKPPRVGEVMRLPALANTLKRVAREGRDGFYKGPAAADMVATLQAAGGLHTLEDFGAQTSQYVTPLATPYNGITLNELPPSNQGIVALILLKMLERLGSLGRDAYALERTHVMLEAARLAYKVRDTFLADPEKADVPVIHMLSDDLIGTLAGRIDRRKRLADLGPIPRPSGSDTVCFSIVDKDGLAVSFINSLFADFGSGIVAKDSGVTFNNRGSGFVLDPRHPNCIGPRKRPLHTLVPAMAMKEGKPWLAYGVMGGAYQPFGHVHVLTNIVDYGMDLQTAFDAPRYFFDGGRVLVEEAMPREIREGLSALGHDVGFRELPWGGGQGVMIDVASGVRAGGSDHRKDGFAIGY
jgi:gamma-glutamyltranspeptidase / glutathione hydrolase